MKSEVLNYLFSEMDEHWIASKKSAERGNMLTVRMFFLVCSSGHYLFWFYQYGSLFPGNVQKAHEWLPNGWQIEIRAGGENMDKMFKVIDIYKP
jgi:hypothetical protein